jgi:hypothetical protein
MEELFESLPMGAALLDLSDPSDVSTWRLASINSFASNLVAPSIETFRSSAWLRLWTCQSSTARSSASGVPERSESLRTEDRLPRMTACLWFQHFQQTLGPLASYSKMSPAAAPTRWRKALGGQGETKDIHQEQDARR